MSERFPRVVVLSHKPDSTGLPRHGDSGEGVILDDDDSLVYVTGTGWYGEWPVDETDIPTTRQVRVKERKQREDHTVGDDSTSEMNAYEYLIKQLRDQGLTHDGAAADRTIALVDDKGVYLRLPSIDEFRKTWDQLEEEGLVKTDA